MTEVRQDPPAVGQGGRRPEPLRVGWVVPPGSAVRMGRILEPLAVGLLDELIEPTLIAPNCGEMGRIPSPPVRLVEYERRRWYQPRRLVWDPVAEQIDPLDLDLLHVMDPEALDVANHLAAACQLPLGMTCLSVRDAGAVHRLNEFGRFVVAISEQILQAVRAQRALPVARIYRVHPGVYPVRHATCFTRLDTPLAIMAGGPLENFHACQAVLRCFAKIRDLQPEVLFFLTGSGPAERPLRGLAEKLGLIDVLTFVSGQADPQMAGILPAADIYISPSPTRWYDLHALQAMAGGVPVIASNRADEDFLIDGHTARLFDPDRPEQLLEALAEMLEDRAATRALAEGALGYLREHHSVWQMVEATAGVYRDAAAKPR